MRRLVIPSLVVLLGLAACSSGSTDATSTAPASAAASSTGATAATEPAPATSTAAPSEPAAATSSAPTVSIADYCDATAPLWDFKAIPNADDEITDTQRADAIASLKAAEAVVLQGVGLGLLDQLQAEVLEKSIPVFIALYENPDLVGADAMPAAADLGLTEEEYALMSSQEFADVSQSATTALLTACGGN